MDELINIIIQYIELIAQIIIILVNLGAAITVVFLERRNPQIAIMWLLLMVFLPILGFIMYLFFGRHLYGKHIFGKKTIMDIALAEAAQNQKEELRIKSGCNNSALSTKFSNTLALLLKADNSIISKNNSVREFTDGEAKFASMKNSIKNAKHHIHLEYFIIRDDELGREIINLIAQKAAEGVEVRMIFDAAGVMHVKNKFYEPVRKAGGDVRIFFPLKIPFLNTRIHFRDHRKILVVDGSVGYIGGFNIGDEYLGKGHLGYWRDTHLKLHGGAVAGLQTRFIMDWNYAAKDAQITVDESDSPYYPESLSKDYGNSIVQIVSSGPDSPEKAIYSGYVSLIGHACESIYIHTPYFIPDESMITALLLAAKSGVDVRIVIPSKPDHPFVYWANHSYLGDLIRAGARGYTYNDGFIHSKLGIFDSEVTTVGTANWDIRSFKLDFETNAFVYDEEFGKHMSEIFLNELETDCTEITLADYNSRPFLMKVKEGISRLVSPLL
ncbi:MAG: cardiolipin synthase [Methanocorpusculum sp.]|nr:cardiolipin synthase [Methanocorpusculum sp.]